jgi:multidrug efflux pump subunit AcrB
MNFNNISAWSIRNPVVPIVLFLGLLMAGILSFNRMDVNNDPDIDFPAAQVIIVQPGAAPSELETQVTQRVEAAIQSIAGVNQISSSVREGSSETFVQFELGTDTNAAVSEVKNAVDQIRSELPDGILEPQIVKVTINGDALVYFAVSAADLTLEQLSWFVDDTVSKSLRGVEGVANVDRNGGVSREIRVTLDPAKMQSLGVTASQINNVLRQLNVNAAGGRAEIAGSRQSVRVLGNADSAFALSQTQISLGNGRSVKLSDVARVTDGFGEQTSIGKLRGRQVITFGITRAKGSSEVTVYDKSVEKLKELEKSNPGIKFTRLFTTVDYTKGQYASSMAAMIEGALLAIVVVFLFLRDWRATLISAIAIPLSAIPTFWFMDLLGFNLNTYSLLALGLVAGVLVDDAIVEIENIVRHMRMGKSAYQASIDAADEIGLAVVATTFSIIAVFLPVGLMPGISGQFFKAFGLTVVIAVFISLAVARMITPMIAAYFMKSHGEASHAQGPWMERYVSMLTWSLNHRWKMVMIGLAAFLATIGMFLVVPIQPFPDANQDFSRIRIEMVPGTTLKQTEIVADKVAAILNAHPDVENALERINEGSAFVVITLKKDRKMTSIEFERSLTPILQKIPDARVNFQADSYGGPSSGRDVTIMLTGSDPILLNDTAAKLVEQMKSIKALDGPRVSADLKRPEVIIRPRLDLAAQLGVTTASLSQAIRIATIGDIDQNSAKFSLSSRQIPIRVMLAESTRSEISTIQNLPVPTASGGTVPLSRVAEISFGSGPTTIQRENQQRRVFVGADIAANGVYGDAIKEVNALPLMKNLPVGVANPVAGLDEILLELVQNFIIAVISGVFLVFGVLVLLYRRFVSPLVNMASLLLAPLGGLIAIWLTGDVISIPVFIGVLMLLGIVGKNSILLIDFALEEIERGVPKAEAIIEAGRKRAQPIVMTTVAMVAGMVPTALSVSGDGAFRAPMGVAVIGGLILSTILTLALVPAGFSLASDIEAWLGKKIGRVLLADYDSLAENEKEAARRKAKKKTPIFSEAGGIQPAE